MSDQLNRRQFVVLGSTAAAALVVSPSALAAGPVTDKSLSVGYCSSARRLRSRTPAPPISFSSAKGGAVSGDGSLLGGARLRLHDFHSSRRAAERLSIDVLFSTDELAEKVPFYAWTADTGSGGKSSPISFNFPVQSVGSVDLLVSRREGTAAPETTKVSFSVNSGGDTIPLAPGIYAIAFLRAGDREPNWNFIRPEGLNSSDAKSSLTLIEDSLTGSEPVAFDYLFMSVSYPKA
jgi:hypothetical protein